MNKQLFPFGCFLSTLKYCLFYFCLLICFLCLLRVWNLFVKNKKVWNCPNDLIYITTELKAIFAAPKRLTSYFTDFKQSKTPFGRNSVTYRTPCHAWGHFVFLLSPCYLQDTMPCQWSSSDLPWVLQIWESIFYSQAFFTLHYFLLVSRPPWDQQFNLKVSRVSC